MKTFCTLAGICGLTLALGHTALFSAPAKGIEVRVLSGRPDMVTGGDALVQVSDSGQLPSQKLVVKIGGRDFSDAFHADAAGKSLIGRVDGLAVGANTLDVAVGGKHAKLELVNYPITGPVFSGPHQTPFVCETEALGLGPALDKDCGVKTKVDFFYRSSTANKFQPFDLEAPRPADLAMTTTSEGKTVPYIVRREMGTINRAVYVIDMLYDPSAPQPTPTGTEPGWNGRLVYSYGGGVKAGFHQGRTIGGLSGPSNFIEETQVGYADYLVAKGYALAGASLNVFGTNCSDLISAETTMMVKEHFIKEFGAPRYTIGAGGSGGSMQQQMIANNYPGLLDGIVPGRSYPDSIEFITMGTDCELLTHVMNAPGSPWTEEQKIAVSGQRGFGWCVKNGVGYPVLRAANCDQDTLKNLAYDPLSNPDGARCTYQDNMVNVYGRDPKTGFARRPFDNVGVQYGLAAFNSGDIGFEQFASLNAQIGGFDIDGKIVPERTVGDADAIQIAYRTGRVNEGGAGDARVPIVDLRSYVDDPYADGSYDVHNAFHSGVMRARLIAANGNANNQVILTVATAGNLQKDIGPGTAPLKTVTQSTLQELDKWLANIASDTSSGSPAEKVARDKPSDLVDACYTSDLQKVTDAKQCSQLFPYHKDARLVAGAPATDDVLKCVLKPVDAKDYAHPLTPEQLQQLKTVFPQGICDYSKPGFGQTRVAEVWRKY